MGLVHTTYDPVRAHATRNFLEANGIPAVVVGELLFPLRGKGIPMAFLPQVWVTDEKHAAQARALIQEHDIATCHPAPFWVRCMALALLLSILLVQILSLVAYLRAY